MLDPLIREVDRVIGELSMPVNPHDDKVKDWHDCRLFNDGGLNVMVNLQSFLMMRIKLSPDGAENTEE